MTEPLPPGEPGPPSDPFPPAIAYSTPPNAGGPPDWIPITALVLGCVNVGSWCLPLCGCPLGITGIVFGVLGMRSTSKRGFAIAGLVMSGIGILLTIGNAALGAYLKFSGRIP